VDRSITLVTDVDADAARVFEVLSTPQGQRGFWTADCDVSGGHARFGFPQAPVDLVTDVSTEPGKLVTVGSRVAFVARFLGRRLAYTYEVKELVPDRRFVQATAEGPFPMETTYTWDDNPDGGTRMRLRNRGEPAGFSKLAAPIMACAMRRANQKDLARLKAILEEPEGLARPGSARPAG
jgi:uncharacterized protein YndB with AHSA1/START domain